MDSFAQDLKYAVRGLFRVPGLALAVIATLAVGIGANTAIFSVANALLFRSLPYPEAERLYVVWNQNLREGIDEDVTSYPNFRDWREQGVVFSGLAAYTRQQVIATGEGDAEELVGTLATADFLPLMGAAPRLGRVPTAAEHEPGASPVVVLSESLWSRRYGGDASLLGKTILLDGVATEVIGVMPADFDFPRGSDYWAPLVPDGDFFEARGALWLNVVGRLAEGTKPEAAQEAMTAVAARLEAEYPDTNGGAAINLEPLRDALVGDIRPAVLLLLGAVGLVLLIACANVANLLLARMTTRYREMAVRVALGAERWRLLRQVLTESVIMALAGAAAGVLLALLAVEAIPALAPQDLPTIGPVQVDGTVLLFTAGLALATGILFGLAPAIHAARQEPGSTLQRGGRWGSAGGRLRPALVVSEVALAIMLLVAAGLMLRSFAALRAVDLGMETEGILAARISPSPARYAGGPEVRRFYSDFLDRLEARPEVESAAAVSTVLLSRLPNMSPISVEGRSDYPDAVRNASVTIDGVSPGAFNLLGIRITEGRALDERDQATATPTAVVNEAFVRRYFGEQHPIGHRVTFGNPEDSTTTWLTIVGVAEDARRSGIAEPPRPELYRPHAQRTTRSMQVLVRGSGPATALEPVLRQTLRELDPEQPAADVISLTRQVADTVADRRFLMVLLGLFAASALVLAAIGLYGVMSYLVGRRRREIATRLALGAPPASVQAMVVADAGRQVVPGIAIGVLASLVAARLLRSYLFGIGSADPATLVVVPLFLAAVAFAAAYFPARRAARIDPAMALRED